MEILFNFYHNFVYTYISLFSIVNPIGMSAVFLTMTKDFNFNERKLISKNIVIYGSILLITVFFLGTYILHFFGIPLAALQISGGLIIFSASWGMLHHDKKEDGTQLIEEKTVENVSFFPLTMPLTTGAGAIATTIALSANINATEHSYVFLDYLAATFGIVGVLITTYFCYIFADKILGKLGKNGTIVVTKLTAFILISIGVTIMWSGIKTLILELITKTLLT